MHPWSNRDADDSNLVFRSDATDAQRKNALNTLNKILEEQIQDGLSENKIVPVAAVSDKVIVLDKKAVE